MTPQVLCVLLLVAGGSAGNAQLDSDGDGFPDGDWHERREYSYTIHSVLCVLRPCQTDFLNDDSQDARELKETDEYVEPGVIHYPLNTIANTISQARSRESLPPEAAAYLTAGVTTNWDDALRTSLLEELRAQGVNPQQLNDRQLVEQVSAWLLRRGNYRSVFGTYFLDL